MSTTQLVRVLLLALALRELAPVDIENVHVPYDVKHFTVQQLDSQP